MRAVDFGFVFLLLSIWSLGLRADQGFHPVSSREVPAKVADAAKKTFRIAIFHDNLKYQVSAEKIAAFKEELDKDAVAYLESLRFYADGMLGKIYLHDLAKLAKDTSYRLGAVGLGTASFVNSGVLVTARHVLTDAGIPKEYFEAKSAEAARKVLTEWRRRLVLVDSEGKVRFDTNEPGQSVTKVVFSGHPEEVKALPEAYHALEKGAIGQMVDTVAFRLKGIETKGLELDFAKAPAAKDRLYVAGYPLKTSRNTKDVPDADGNSLRVSTGLAYLEAPASYQKFLKTIMKDEERKLYESSLVFSNADAVVGNSGSAYLNAQGELVSIVGAIRHDPSLESRKTYPDPATYGPKFSLLAPLFGKE